MFVLVVVLFLVGCKGPADEMQEVTQEPTTETTPESDVQDVESDLEEIESLEEDIDFSELDTLEQELDEIDW